MRIDRTTLCHGPIKAELVPQVGHDASHRGGKIGDDLTSELLDSLLHVFSNGFCTWTLHHCPPANNTVGSDDCAETSCNGPRVRAERELSTSHSMDSVDTTAGLLRTAWITGWLR